MALRAGVSNHTTMTSARCKGTSTHLTKVPEWVEAGDSKWRMSNGSHIDSSA